MPKKILTYKNMFIVIAIFMMIFLTILWVAGPQIKYEPLNIESADADGVLGGVYEGRTINQDFFYSGKYIQKITLMTATYNRKNNGFEKFTLKNSYGTIIWEERIASEKIKNDAMLTLQIGRELKSENDLYTLAITGEGNVADNAVTFYTDTNPSYRGTMSDSDGTTNQSLYMNIFGRGYASFNYGFIIFFASLLLLMISYWCKAINCTITGKENKLVGLLEDYQKYGFLMKQLVLRDFKTKYKRSVLGVLWSFLNPILTMAVQYVVFSTIFRSGIENFPVYLLSASILFNFFTESVGNGLGSITGNVSLITKVAIPRYIYPISKVLSSGINLLMSMIPLLIVVLITGCQINVSYVFIPYIFLILIVFCIGFSMILSTSMVFFRDTQFLWGVISLLWMYATPIFYPESIIPDRFAFIFRFNPMYYYLKFFRTVLMDGIAPELSLMLICALWSLGMLLVGIYVFSKNEKKFTLYI